MTASVDYVDKITKLLNKAQGTDVEAEAEAFRDKAYELMAQFRIDEAEIEARRRAAGGSRKDEKIVEKDIPLTGVFRYGLRDLSFFVIDAMPDVSAYFIDNARTEVKLANGKTRWAESVIFIVVGYESDVDQAILLLTSLHLQAATALVPWWNGESWHRTLGRGEAFRSKRSFIRSFGAGAGQKIRLATVKARVGMTSGAELVLRDKSVAVQDYLAKYQMKHAKNRNQNGPTGSKDGYDAGQRADTGEKKVGNRRMIE